MSMVPGAKVCIEEGLDKVKAVMAPLDFAFPDPPFLRASETILTETDKNLHHPYTILTNDHYA